MDVTGLLVFVVRPIIVLLKRLVLVKPPGVDDGMLFVLVRDADGNISNGVVTKVTDNGHFASIVNPASFLLS